MPHQSPLSLPVLTNLGAKKERYLLLIKFCKYPSVYLTNVPHIWPNWHGRGERISAKKSLRYCCGHHGRKADGRLGAKDIVIDDNAEQRMWGSKGTVSGSVGGEIGELSLHDDMSYERTESDGLQWLASSQTLVHGLDGRNGHGNNYFISILHKI